MKTPKYKMKRKLPKTIEYTDLDHLESRKRFTPEYIEQRIREQKHLNKDERKQLSPELQKYYDDLKKEINELKNKKI